MYKKIKAARQRAYLAALAECGNLTLAAERAKVSRSWALQHRRRDAAFDAACIEALAAAKARLSAHGERAPPSGWGFLDGEELVVRGGGGSGGRRVQIARARLKQWTPRVEDRFLAVLAVTCNVKAAAAAAGMSFTSAYAHRIRWPGFARRWDEAAENAEVALQFAIVRHASNPFAAPQLPEPAPMPPMRADEMFHNLYMHKRQLTGQGGEPGRAARRPDIEEVTVQIERAAAALKRARGMSAADKARREEDYARRRPG